MEAGQGPTASFAFGRFRLLPQQRQLFADSAPVELGGRAFDVLMALTEAPGAVVSKHALTARVWPGCIIEENSLAAQIAALRAAFGAERALIRTVSRRGYQLTGEVRVVPESSGEAVGAVAAQPASVLPPCTLRSVVREPRTDSDGAPRRTQCRRPAGVSRYPARASRAPELQETCALEL